jgi:hypothetical protein
MRLRLLQVIATFVVLNSVLLAWFLFGQVPSKEAPMTPDRFAAKKLAEVKSSDSQIRVGEWGELELVPLAIAPPTEFAVDLEQDDLSWVLPDLTPEQWQTFVQSLPMPAELQNDLLTYSSFNTLQKKLMVNPSLEFLGKLPQDARRLLYNRLAYYQDNFAQHNAYRFPSSFEETLLANPSLPTGTVDFLKKYLYRAGIYTFFADVGSLRAQFPAPQDRSLILKVLASQETFLVKLKIDHDSQISSLTNYWGKGGRAKDIGPIMESLRSTHSSQTIDIVHLLPGFARRRLYTYPKPDETSSTGRRDCHWTAFNFFLDTPDDKYSEPNEVTAALDKEYYPIYGNVGFGDLVTFSDPNGSIFHSAIMIADDILYTKNGAGSHSPWVFMKMKNMLEYYPRPGKIRVSYFRKTGL